MAQPMTDAEARYLQTTLSGETACLYCGRPSTAVPFAFETFLCPACGKWCGCDKCVDRVRMIRP